jgi:nucleoid-associated protein YgaU
MPLTIVANRGAAPAPQVVAPQTVVQRAQQGGNPNAALGLAYTHPNITIDQTGLSYRQRQTPTGVEFQFDTGTLTLTLRQDMLISNTLSSCAQQKWILHENGHVHDNQAVMTQMDAAIRAERTLQGILINPQWAPRARFQATQQTIFNAVSAIFQRLTARAVAARDTRPEYMRVQRDILLNCPGPYIYEVNRGDTLSQIADFFYGRSTAWQSIYRANQGVIGGDPTVIRAGQRLVIPRTP